MQTNLNMFLSKHKNSVNSRHRQSRQDQDVHDSSRENSQTEVIEPINEKVNKVNNQHIKTALISKPLILPSPSDLIIFPKIYKDLLNLKKNYNPTNRTSFYEFLLSNLQYHKQINNVQILKRIEDDTFWKITLPKMIAYFIQKHQNICASIRTLVMTKKGQTIVTRQQALLILISVFFGIMPKNPFTKTRSFGQFMTIRPQQKSEDLKLEKLKFIINYFNIAIEKVNEQASVFPFEAITFQKTVSNTYDVRKDFETQNYQLGDGPLIDVQFCEQDELKIQDFNGKAAMVDFANCEIGGGVLRSGCVQEELLFLIFPEAIVSMFITPQIADNESIIIYGLRRYSNYINYSYDIKYDGAYEQQDPNQVNNSVMIAIDATRFNNKYDAQIQFDRQYTLRQMVKAITGFRSISESRNNDFNDLKICTGRWGCGAFRGDQVWKFFIQWIACSYTQRGMIYISDQKQIVEELKYAVKKMVDKSKTVLDLFSMMQHFMQVKKRINKPPINESFIDFLKSETVL